MADAKKDSCGREAPAEPERRASKTAACASQHDAWIRRQKIRRRTVSRAGSKRIAIGRTREGIYVSSRPSSRGGRTVPSRTTSCKRETSPPSSRSRLHDRRKSCRLVATVVRRAGFTHSVAGPPQDGGKKPSRRRTRRGRVEKSPMSPRELPGRTCSSRTARSRRREGRSADQQTYESFRYKERTGKTDERSAADHFTATYAAWT